MLVLLLSLFAFAGRNVDSQIKTLNARIDKVAASDLSCKVKEDCVYFASGKMACGGPQRFVLTSKNNKNLKTLESDIQKVTKLEDKHNKDNDVISTCIAIGEPLVACEENRCTAN